MNKSNNDKAIIYISQRLKRLINIKQCWLYHEAADFIN